MTTPPRPPAPTPDSLTLADAFRAFVLEDVSIDPGDALFPPSIIRVGAEGRVFFDPVLLEPLSRFFASRLLGPVGPGVVSFDEGLATISQEVSAEESWLVLRREISRLHARAEKLHKSIDAKIFAGYPFAEILDAIAEENPVGVYVVRDPETGVIDPSSLEVFSPLNSGPGSTFPLLEFVLTGVLEPLEAA